MKGKILMGALRVLVAIGLLAFVASRVHVDDWVGEGGATQQGLRTLLSDARLDLILGAWALYHVSILTTSWRWWILLRAVDVHIPFRRALGLKWISLTFSQVIPGLTGGDLVIIGLMMKETDHRARAVASLVMDRVIGLGTLLLLALVASSLQPGFRTIALQLGGVAAVGAMGVFCYAHPGLRKWGPVKWIMDRLPLRDALSSLDEAFLAYRHRPGAVLLATGLSVVNHLSILACIGLFARSLGDGSPPSFFLAVMPIVQMVSGLPIAPAGWGVGESMFGWAFETYAAGATPAVRYTLGITASVLYRVNAIVSSLPGAVIMAVWKRKAQPTAAGTAG